MPRTDTRRAAYVTAVTEANAHALPGRPLPHAVVLDRQAAVIAIAVLAARFPRLVALRTEADTMKLLALFAALACGPPFLGLGAGTGAVRALGGLHLRAGAAAVSLPTTATASDASLSTVPACSSTTQAYRSAFSHLLREALSVASVVPLLSFRHIVPRFGSADRALAHLRQHSGLSGSTLACG